MKIIYEDKVYVQMRSLLFLASYYSDEVFLSMYFNSMLNGVNNDDFIYVNDDNIANIIVDSMFIFDYMDSMEYSISELNFMLDSLNDVYLEGKQKLLFIHKKSDIEDMIKFRKEGLPHNFVNPNFNVYNDVFKLLKKDN